MQSFEYLVLKAELVLCTVERKYLASKSSKEGY